MHAGLQMGEAALGLRLSAAEAKFVRQSQLRPAGGALRRGLIDGLKALVFEGSHNQRRRHVNFFDGGVFGRNN